jgi:hypothetical protein
VAAVELHPQEEIQEVLVVVDLREVMVEQEILHQHHHHREILVVPVEQHQHQPIIRVVEVAVPVVLVEALQIVLVQVVLDLKFLLEGLLQQHNQ